MTGYQSKKAAALDEEGMYLVHPLVFSDFVPPQPAQEPPPWWPAVENILTEYGLQAINFVADFNAALAGRERNFCERCGKRTADLTVIHTCTPPQDKNNG